MRVTHLNGSLRNGNDSSGWLAPWERVIRQKAYMCFTKDCINTPASGGLVQEKSPSDSRWYVVPL